MTATLKQELSNLSRAEKILLVEDLWDEIAKDDDADPVSPALAAELQHRLEEFRRNPASGIPWTEVKRQLLGRE
jgi:putative addiction module component (TIGR02574 family)